MGKLNRREVWVKLLLFTFFFLATVALQIHTGAYSAEFTYSPDEPAHFVTGLMVRDYLASGLSTSPMAFARDYYEHYPKVAIGHWPPFFYLLQGVWMLLLPPGRVSIFLLMALLSTLVVFTVATLVRQETDWWTGAAAGLFLMAIPVWQAHTSAVMTEVLITGLILWAILALESYFDKPRWQSAACFGILASLALLSKGTGVALAPVPLLAVILTRRLPLLRKPTFWLPAAIVVLFCLPWYALAPAARHEKVIEFGGVAVHGHKTNELLAYLISQFGVIAALLMAAAFAWVLWNLFRNARLSSRYAIFVSLIASELLFYWTITVWNPRHLISVLPVVAFLAAIALSHVARRLPGTPRWLSPAVLLALTAVSLYHSPHKYVPGLREVAAAVARDPALDRAGILVLSSSLGEGVLVSEIALADHRPNRFVLRGSKIISHENWLGRPTAGTASETPQRVQQELESLPVGEVVLDTAPRESNPARSAMLATLARFPDRWILAASFRRTTPPGEIHLYRLAAHPPQPLRNPPNQLGALGSPLSRTQ